MVVLWDMLRPDQALRHLSLTLIDSTFARAIRCLCDSFRGCTDSRLETLTLEFKTHLASPWLFQADIAKLDSVLAMPEMAALRSVCVKPGSAPVAQSGVQVFFPRLCEKGIFTVILE